MTAREKLIASQQAACLPLFCEVFVVSQICHCFVKFLLSVKFEAEANSAKTMKAIPIPRVILGLKVYL